MSLSKKELGVQGERVATDWLQQNGFLVVARNWRYRRFEVDIIARKSGFVIFVEVKTRKGVSFGEPIEFVSLSQEKNLAEAAQAYVEAEDIDDEIRFDIIGIVLRGNEVPKITHLADVFRPLV